jgi:hypothetical protein
VTVVKISEAVKKLEGSLLRRGGAKDPTALAAQIGRARQRSAPPAPKGK